MLKSNTATPQHRNTATKPIFCLLVTSLAILGCTHSNPLLASPKTYGYVLTMPNRFWPDTAMPPDLLGRSGNAIQQETAANNPDVFCESQGSGYRLPSIGEFHANTKDLSPGSSYRALKPAHWSQYVANDTSKALLPNNNTRSITGSLYNEWGDVSKYQNGWEAGNYWSTEVSVVRNTYYTTYVGGISRMQFIGTGSTTYGPSTSNKGQVITDINALRNVACVRDLVPTPSTPNPSKT